MLLLLVLLLLLNVFVHVDALFIASYMQQVLHAAGPTCNRSYMQQAK